MSFDKDTGQPAAPVALSIEADGCPHGVATGLISGTADGLPFTAYPPDWDVAARHGKTGCQILTPMTLQAPAVSDSPAAAPVLTDPSGGYRQLAVDASGKRTTRSLRRAAPK